MHLCYVPAGASTNPALVNVQGKTWVNQHMHAVGVSDFWSASGEPYIGTFRGVQSPLTEHFKSRVLNTPLIHKAIDELLQKVRDPECRMKLDDPTTYQPSSCLPLPPMQGNAGCWGRGGGLKYKQWMCAFVDALLGMLHVPR